MRSPEPVLYFLSSFARLPKSDAEPVFPKSVPQPGQGAAFDGFLANHGLPPASMRYLVITKEHPDWGYSSGIGSYVQEMEKAMPAGSVGILYLGTESEGEGRFPPGNFIREHRWLTPRHVLPAALAETLPAEELALEAVRAACALYPELSMIEFQDCDGVGLSVARAARAGLLPEHITTVARCHGSQVYLEHAFGQWQGTPDQVAAMVKERQSMALAHKTRYATRFLERLYRESGYGIPEENKDLLRYPFSFPEKSPIVKYGELDTLIFFGRRNKMKGFDLFARAVARLEAQGGHPIRRVLLLGGKDVFLTRENRFFQGLASIRVAEQALPRDEALALLARLAGRSLCVMPYRADNHPSSVLEAAACGCPILAANTGGVPELIPDGLDSVLADPSPKGLARGVLEAAKLSAKEREGQARDMLTAMREAQEKINKAHQRLVRVSGRDKLPASQPPPARPKVAVVLDQRKAKGQAWEKTLQSLKKQTLEPACVIFWGQEEGPEEGDAGRVPVLHAPDADRLLELMESEEWDFLALVEPETELFPDFLRAQGTFLQNVPACQAAMAYRLSGGGPANMVQRPQGLGGLLFLAGAGLFGGLPGEPVDDGSAAPEGSGSGMLRPEVMKAWLEKGGRLPARVLFSVIQTGVIPQVLSWRQEPNQATESRSFFNLRDAALFWEGPDAFERLRLAGFLDAFSQTRESQAWTMAQKLTTNPRLVKGARSLMLLLDRVHPWLKKWKIV